MKYIDRTYLTLFVFSTLFLLLFTGVYSIYVVYFNTYLHNDYEWYSFSSGKGFPTKTQLLISGFQSIYTIIDSLVIATVLVFIAKRLKTFNRSKSTIGQILYTAFSWTILIAALFTISSFVWYRQMANFNNSFSLGVIRKQLPFLVVLYFIMILPIVIILYKTKRTQ